MVNNTEITNSAEYNNYGLRTLLKRGTLPNIFYIIMNTPSTANAIKDDNTTNILNSKYPEGYTLKNISDFNTWENDIPIDQPVLVAWGNKVSKKDEFKYLTFLKENNNIIIRYIFNRTNVKKYTRFPMGTRTKPLNIEIYTDTQFNKDYKKYI